MEIFSLETKKHLVGWSVVLGLALGILVNGLVAYSPCRPTQPGYTGELTFAMDACIQNLQFRGFPFKYSSYGRAQIYYGNEAKDAILGIYKSEIFNVLFWALVVFIILNLARYFIKKQNQFGLKSN